MTATTAHMCMVFTAWFTDQPSIRRPSHHGAGNLLGSGESRGPFLLWPGRMGIFHRSQHELIFIFKQGPVLRLAEDKVLTV